MRDVLALRSLSRLAGFHRTMNELRVKDGAMGGTLWLAGPPQMPEAVEQSRTIMVMKARHTTPCWIMPTP
jgi:hypothetical protein